MTTSTPSRRRFLHLSTVTAGATFLVPATAARPARGAAAPRFAHGVASGDPRPDGVLLWTRVTPTRESAPGSGTGPEAAVGWAVYRDPGLTDTVARGSVVTGPGRDHTVKVDVHGLAPDTTYWYRFALDGVTSRIGRTRTAPATAAAPRRLRFGLVSCSNWQAGHFAAYRHLAARRDLDLVVHVGDYLYAYPAGRFPAGRRVVRRHSPVNELRTLADYRRRHAQYKSDPDLRTLHARLPWAVTWDDHETANNAWARGAQLHQPATDGPWRDRVAAARRAYLEWMPIRPTTGERIYRRLRFGTLADLSLLDLRSYRSRQVSPLDGSGISDPARTITGRRQLRWVEKGLEESDARWRLVGNSVMISPVGLDFVPDDVAGALAQLFDVPREGLVLNTDAWDGYGADRRRLLDHLARNRIENTVFLTGDIHSSWACDVPRDAALYPFAQSLATEIVCTSVTSDNVDDFLGIPPRSASPFAESVIRGLNRHVKFAELDSHGYVVVDVDAERVQADWFFLTDRRRRDSGARRAASFAVGSGTQHLRRVAEAIR